MTLYIRLAHRHANPKDHRGRMPGSGFKSRSGQIAYFHGVKTRLSTLAHLHLEFSSRDRQ